MEADKPSVSHTPFRHRSSLFYSWTSAAALLDSKAGSNARRVDVFDWRKKRFRGRNAEREDGGSGMIRATVVGRSSVPARLGDSGSSLVRSCRLSPAGLSLGT